MGASEILLANVASTRFPSLSADVTVASTYRSSAPFVVRSRTLSRFAATADAFELDVMSRVIEGSVDGGFLIEQRSSKSPSPDVWVKRPHEQRPKKHNFEPWEPFARSALRWMDYIIPPPGTFTAAVNEAAAPFDPAWQPPAPCWIIDLTLAPSFWKEGPTLARLWIEKTAGRAVDHRVEQHLSNGDVRVIVSAGWGQLPSAVQWGPALRTVTDPVLETRTAIQVDSADANPLDPNLFTAAHMAEGNW